MRAKPQSRKGIYSLRLCAFARIHIPRIKKKLSLMRSRKVAKEFILCSSPRKVGRQGVNSLRLCALAS
jgi:hypothetical protein